MKGNFFIVVENDTVKHYVLDDRLLWHIGRMHWEDGSGICVHGKFVSRCHGRLQNMDGVWFYLDDGATNGTTINGKYITEGEGHVNPILLNDGDEFVFGGGRNGIRNKDTVWARYTTSLPEKEWRAMYAKGFEGFTIAEGDKVEEKPAPGNGVIAQGESGVAINAGPFVFVNGNIRVTGL